MCILFEICEKRPFQKCMGWGGGRWSHFSAQHNTLDGAHKHGTAPLNHFYSGSSSLSASPFSGRAGVPLGQTSPCLWTGIYFFNFSQSCNFRAFTGTHPSERGIIGCEVHISLFGQPDLAPGQVAVNGRYGAVLPGYQAHAVAPTPRLLPQSEPFCAPKAFVVHRGKQQPVE